MSDDEEDEMFSESSEMSEGDDSGSSYTKIFFQVQDAAEGSKEGSSNTPNLNDNLY